MVAVLVICLAVTTGAVAATTQTITLHPGWNAVFLEVQPDDRAPATVFKDLPVESVWTWFDRTTSVEFIRDPADGLWAQPGWSVYAKSPDKATAINLYAIFANRAYLIKLGGRQTVTWSVTGAPATGKILWTPNSFNLVGFHINPNNPPAFAEYLSPSPAHAGQPVYRLSSLGAWELVATPAATTIKSGEAYWVYCNGSSTYQSPVNVQIMGSGLDYGTISDMNTVTITNDSTTTRTATIKFQPPADWFTYQSFNATTGLNEYPKLDTWTLQLSAGRQTNIWLAVRRELLATGVYEGNLEITDDVGSRFLVPVRVEKQ
jgi:hypothetical protein